MQNTEDEGWCNKQWDELENRLDTEHCMPENFGEYCNKYRKDCKKFRETKLAKEKPPLKPEPVYNTYDYSYRLNQRLQHPKRYHTKR